jgi:hypothetical protein
MVMRILNQHLGDKNDYFKHNPLILLAEIPGGIKKLAIWMLTENDESLNGGIIEYSWGVDNKGLFQFPRDSFTEEGRNSARIGECARAARPMLKSRPYGAVRPSIKPDLRACFGQIQPEKLCNTVIPLDSDNGPEVNFAIKEHPLKEIVGDADAALKFWNRDPYQYFGNKMILAQDSLPGGRT